MIKPDKKKGKWKTFMQGKGFYGVLAICVFAVGVASFAAIENLQVPSAEQESNPIGYIVDDTPAGATVSNIKDDRETQETTQDATEVTESQTEAETQQENAENANEENAPTVKPYEGFFMLPLNTDITKDYSGGELVYSDTMRDWRAHNGIDFKAEKNSQVAAVNDGTVKAVYQDPLWGGVIEIDHGGGIVARYCGVTPAPSIKVDAQIQMGQELGTVSEIPLEAVEQLHLHFEVLVNGKYDDPLKVLNKQGEE